jgi:hypothetical protein
MIRPSLSIVLALVLAACSDAALPSATGEEAPPPSPLAATTDQEGPTFGTSTLAAVDGPVARRFIPVADHGQARLLTVPHDADADKVVKELAAQGHIVTAALGDEDARSLLLVATRAAGEKLDVQHARCDRSEIAEVAVRMARTGVAVTAVATYSSTAHLFGVKVARPLEPLAVKAPLDRRDGIAEGFAGKGFMTTTLAREYGAFTALGYRDQERPLQTLTFHERVEDTPALLRKLAASKFVVSGALANDEGGVTLLAYRGHVTYGSRASVVSAEDVQDAIADVGRNGWVTTSIVRVADQYVLVSTR